MGAPDDRNEEPIPLLQLGLPSPPPMAVDDDDDLFNSDETVNSSDHKRTGLFPISFFIAMLFYSLPIPIFHLHLLKIKLIGID